VTSSSALPSRLLLTVFVISAVTLPFVAPTYYVQFASKVLLMGLAAMALNLVVGFGGLISVCHAAFFGLSAYMLAIAAPRYEAASLWLTLPVATGAAAVAALVIGALSLRTRGVYFIMVTLAFGEMLFFLFHDTTIGGGSDGAYIYYKPQLAIAGHTLIDIEKPSAFYFLVLGVVLLSILFLRMLTQSPFGHALVAARENERRATSLGFPNYRIRLTAFVISGALAGVSGYFSAAQFGFVAPQMLGWHFSATLLVMAVLGGMRSVTGPLIGAIILLGLEEVLKGVTEYWKLFEGSIVIFIVLAQPTSLRHLLRLVVTSLSTEPSNPRRPVKTAPNAGKVSNA
jgi:branched-chain amino acid transport system permease protein